MILDQALFDSLSPGSTKIKIAVKCDECGTKKTATKRSILKSRHGTYTICRMCAHYHCAKSRIVAHKNENFFSVPSFENSYWAGFIAADAYLGQRGNEHTIKLALATKDKNHLVKFCSSVSRNAKIVDGTVKLKSKEYQTSYVRLGSVKQWHQDLLSQYGICSKNKSLNLPAPPPTVNGDVALSYIKGIIDGDGCIRLTNDGYMSLSVVGTQALLVWIKETLDDRFPPLPNKKLANITKFKHSHAYNYRICGERAIRILKYLKSIQTPRLDRKWDKVPD